MGDLLKIKKGKGLSIKNKNATTAEITIYSSIGEDFWGDAVSAKSFHNELKNLSDKITNIDVRINSPGGDVFDGITIYNRLKQHKAKVTTYVDGMAASIASIIALAGDEVIFSEGASMMIHKPWTLTAGNSLELQETIDRLEDVEEQLVGIYARKTGLDRSEIKNMLAKETWFLADEAIELGFADKSMEGMAIAASMEKAVWIRNKAGLANKQDSMKDKITNKLKEMTDYLAR